MASRENINTATTRTITTGGGTLIRVVVNTTAAGTITIYDDDTAVATNKIATIKSNVLEGVFEYGVPFTRGLTIVTAAASDITVVYT